MRYVYVRVRVHVHAIWEVSIATGEESRTLFAELPKTFFYVLCTQKGREVAKRMAKYCFVYNSDRAMVN